MWRKIRYDQKSKKILQFFLETKQGLGFALTILYLTTKTVTSFKQALCWALTG
jgi:hypothetical protein